MGSYPAPGPSVHPAVFEVFGTTAGDSTAGITGLSVTRGSFFFM
jgi:hypothetical protein